MLLTGFHVKQFTSDSQKTGEIGENIAVKFLVKHGYTVLDRNYTKKWGEIDIVAEKGNLLHFFEVKSVARADVNRDLPAGRQEHDSYRPEDNMHPWKLKRLSRAIQTYILQKKLDDRDWQFDLLVVFLNLKDKKAKVKMVEDIVL